MNSSPARPKPPLRWSTRLGAAAVAIAGLLLGLPARPALAADPQITVTIAQRWQLASTQGTWTPYVVTVKDNGPGPFTGDVFLLPSDTRSTASNTYPVYRASISLQRGAQRAALFDVIDAPNGYVAEVTDQNGHVAGRAEVADVPHASSALGILSDLAQADQKIAAPLHALTRVDSALTRFASAQDFPTNAVYLSGLSGLVIDQFDSAALSQAQVQALKDYVGLGGTLIEAGGPSWRRTLLSLPQELLPMRPTSTSTASLSALSDLAGRPTDATAQVASGTLTGGRATLVAADGQPLVVEGTYGTGHVVELTFDPFAEPFDTQVELSAMAWGHAISRALSDVEGGSRTIVSNGFGTGSSFGSGSGPVAAFGSWAPGYTSSADQISNILHNTPAGTTPPVGLLGGLLVAYVLLAGVLNYLFLKAMGRRQYMWISVPIIAVVFTTTAYAVGFGSRGSDYRITQVQIQRLAPEGAVESYTFQGVYPPQKGDVTLNVPPTALVSTAVALGSFGDSSGGALITAGSHAQVVMTNVPVYSMRPVQTHTVSHPYSYEPNQSAALDAQLSLSKGHVVGKVVNLSQHPISDLELVSASGTEAVLANSLAPGATASVDVELTPGAAGPIASSQGVVKPVPGLPESSRDAMVRLATSEAINGVQGALALVGFAPATEATSVEGSVPQAQVAAVVEPIDLQAADSLAGISPRPRLVSSYGSPDGTTQVDVYDFDLPGGLTAAPGLSYQLPDTAQPNVRSVEVYDWGAHTWRSLPKQPVTTGQRGPVPLNPGEVVQGVVRVRVVEGFATNGASLAVGDVQG